ncbi:hypothetical protein ACIP3A_18510 [Streptomyces tricolor]|uniref:hypothetical protein n=1 Tax=Streptomyces tricolor TaxID=68277 RepID=UPI00381B8FAB
MHSFLIETDRPESERRFGVVRASVRSMQCMAMTAAVDGVDEVLRDLHSGAIVAADGEALKTVERAAGVSRLLSDRVGLEALELLLGQIGADHPTDGGRLFRRCPSGCRR